MILQHCYIIYRLVGALEQTSPAHYPARLSFNAFFFFENLNWTSQNLQCCSPVLSPFYFTIYSTFFSSSHVRKICSTRFGSSAVYSQHALHCCLYLTETQLVGHPFLCMVEFQGGLVWNWANCSFVS